MSSVEALMVFSVASFHLTVVSGCVRSDEFVADTQLFQTYLKDGRLIRTAMRRKEFCKFLSVVGLNTFYGAWKRLDEMFQKKHRRIGTVSFKGFHKTPSGMLVNSSILEKMLSFGFIYKADRRNEFDINLNTLTRIMYLFVRLSNIFGISRFKSHHAVLTEEAV